MKRKNQSDDLAKLLSLPEVSLGPIDKESPLPLHYQIKQVLIRYIAKCNAGDPFPGEVQLCDVFSVSRPTVRQAIANLVQEGILERTAGKGTFVTASRVRRDFRLTFQTFEYEMQASGRSSKTEILGFEKINADELLSGQLGIAVGSSVYKINRRRSTNETPLVSMINYLPADLFPELESRYSKLTALRKLMEMEYQVYLSRVTRNLEAVSADSVQAQLLGIPVGVPIQFIQTHGYLKEGRCAEYSRAWYRGDCSSFFFELNRDSLDNGN